MKFSCFFATFLNWLICTIQAQQLNFIEIQHLAKTQRFLHYSRAQQIPYEFYKTIEKSDGSKQNLQHKLSHFLEKLQKNLTLSAVLSDSENTLTGAANYILRLKELSFFFFDASDTFKQFSTDSKIFYEISKNTSYELLLKLRQVPTAQPTVVKVWLTNYFAEMEYFQVFFSEIIDEAMDFSTETLKAIQQIFLYYAEIQSNLLENWKLKFNLECRKLYVDFLQHHSAQLFKCAAENNLNMVYDVYSVTKLNVKYIMKELEFRVQLLFNCFMYRSFAIRRKFLKNVEKDLKNVFNKITELEMYLDVRTKNGSYSALKFRQETTIYDTIKSETTIKDCLPIGFPHSQMSAKLKECFYDF
ncbi:uncharacterized protein LOC108105569 [Drosophila eugracilis]|uniref:uncharacterized protein LOC108105569 n=1 Tax=Drosophila eugracilis TaxID=29029 RepID=UPI001BD93C65|nr:uncharacterized protein LOC108105569 [Drosophila eugracilis]